MSKSSPRSDFVRGSITPPPLTNAARHDQSEKSHNRGHHFSHDVTANSVALTGDHITGWEKLQSSITEQRNAVTELRALPIAPFASQPLSPAHLPRQYHNQRGATKDETVSAVTTAVQESSSKPANRSLGRKTVGTGRPSYAEVRRPDLARMVVHGKVAWSTRNLNGYFACFCCKRNILAARSRQKELPPTSISCPYVYSERSCRRSLAERHIRPPGSSFESGSLSREQHRLLNGPSYERARVLCKALNLNGSEKDEFLWREGFASLFPAYARVKHRLDPFGYGDPDLDMFTLRELEAQQDRHSLTSSVLPLSSEIITSTPNRLANANFAAPARFFLSSLNVESKKSTSNDSSHDKIAPNEAERDSNVPVPEPYLLPPFITEFQYPVSDPGTGTPPVQDSVPSLTFGATSSSYTDTPSYFQRPVSVFGDSQISLWENTRFPSLSNFELSRCGDNPLSLGKKDELVSPTAESDTEEASDVLQDRSGAISPWSTRLRATCVNPSHRGGLCNQALPVADQPIKQEVCPSSLRRGECTLQAPKVQSSLYVNAKESEFVQASGIGLDSVLRSSSSAAVSTEQSARSKNGEKTHVTKAGDPKRLTKVLALDLLGDSSDGSSEPDVPSPHGRPPFQQPDLVYRWLQNLPGEDSFSNPSMRKRTVISIPDFLPSNLLRLREGLEDLLDEQPDLVPELLLSKLDKQLPGMQQLSENLGGSSSLSIKPAVSGELAGVARDGNKSQRNQLANDLLSGTVVQCTIPHGAKVVLISLEQLCISLRHLEELLAQTLCFPQQIRDPEHYQDSDVIPPSSEPTATKRSSSAISRSLSPGSCDRSRPQKRIKPKSAPRAIAGCSMMRKETMFEDFACFWYKLDSEMYEACQDKHFKTVKSLRRHHLLDHYERGDLTEVLYRQLLDVVETCSNPRSTDGSSQWHQESYWRRSYITAFSAFSNHEKNLNPYWGHPLLFDEDACRRLRNKQHQLAGSTISSAPRPDLRPEIRQFESFPQSNNSLGPQSHVISSETGDIRSSSVRLEEQSDLLAQPPQIPVRQEQTGIANTFPSASIAEGVSAAEVERLQQLLVLVPAMVEELRALAARILPVGAHYAKSVPSSVGGINLPLEGPIDAHGQVCTLQGPLGGHNAERSQLQRLQNENDILRQDGGTVPESLSNGLGNSSTGLSSGVQSMTTGTTETGRIARARSMSGSRPFDVEPTSHDSSSRIIGQRSGDPISQPSTPLQSFPPLPHLEPASIFDQDEGEFSALLNTWQHPDCDQERGGHSPCQ